MLPYWSHRAIGKPVKWVYVLLIPLIINNLARCSTTTRLAVAPCDSSREGVGSGVERGKNKVGRKRKWLRGGGARSERIVAIQAAHSDCPNPITIYSRLCRRIFLSV